MVATKNNVGVMVVNYHGKVISLSEKVNNLKNDKKTPFRIGVVGIKYPDGGEAEIPTRFYTKSIEAHPDVFKVGEKIGLEIQAEGEYAGRAVAKLHGEIVDINRILGKVSVSKAVPSTGDAVEVEA